MGATQSKSRNEHGGEEFKVRVCCVERDYAFARK
jgi:hypothetical protein